MSQSTIFQFYLDRSSWVEPVLKQLGLMCLAQGHNAVNEVRLESATPQSRVKHCTTEPLPLYLSLLPWSLSGASSVCFVGRFLPSSALTLSATVFC